jgi:hypothetical protein
LTVTTFRRLASRDALVPAFSKFVLRRCTWERGERICGVGDKILMPPAR